MHKIKQIITKFQIVLLGIVQFSVATSAIVSAQVPDLRVGDSLASDAPRARHQLSLARQLLENDRPAEAEAQLDRAIAQRHDLVEAYLLRAALRKTRGDLEGAITDYSSAIHLQPDYHEARFGRAQAYYERQRYDAARKDFQYLLDRSGGITNKVFYRGGVQRGEFVASSATTLQSNMKSDWLNYLGLCYWHTEDYRLAEQCFTEAIEHTPQEPMGYVNLGLTYEARQDTLRAIRTYQRALAVAPSHRVAQRNLLSLARQQNDTTLEAQTLAYTADDLSYDSYFQRGLSYLRQDEYDSAVRHFTQALALEPHRSEALLQRGFAYEKMLRFSEALADYTTVVRLDPTVDKAYSNRGNIYFRQKEYERAVDDYNQALAIDPNNATVWLNRGLTHHYRGERETACRDLQRAVDLGSRAAAAPLAKLCSD